MGPHQTGTRRCGSGIWCRGMLWGSSVGWGGTIASPPLGWHKWREGWWKSEGLFHPTVLLEFQQVVLEVLVRVPGARHSAALEFGHQAVADLHDVAAGEFAV